MAAAPVASRKLRRLIPLATSSSLYLVLKPVSGSPRSIGFQIAMTLVARLCSRSRDVFGRAGISPNSPNSAVGAILGDFETGHHRRADPRASTIWSAVARRF